MAAAAASSTFAFSEVRVGVAPAMILVPALRVVERRFLARMALTGERFSAHEAAGAGLLSAVDRGRGCAAGLGRRADTGDRHVSPGAVRATKSLLRALPARVGPKD